MYVIHSNKQSKSDLSFQGWLHLRAKGIHDSLFDLFHVEELSCRINRVESLFDAKRCWKAKEMQWRFSWSDGLISSQDRVFFDLSGLCEVFSRKSSNTTMSRFTTKPKWWWKEKRIRNGKILQMSMKDFFNNRIASHHHTAPKKSTIHSWTRPGELLDLDL